jgi:hypothetical protein
MNKSVTLGKRLGIGTGTGSIWTNLNSSMRAGSLTMYLELHSVYKKN